MKRQHLGLSVIALAILIVGLTLAGVPTQTLLFGLILLACPLMMMFMMGGGHGHGSGTDDTHKQHPTSVRRGPR